MLDDDLPPLSFPSHEGQAQWLVREALQRKGHTVRFEAVPWARCILGVEHGPYDAALGAGANPKFFSFMRFPLRNAEVDHSKILGSITQIVVRRPGTRPDWNGENFLGLKTAVMYRRGYASVEKKLLDLGVPGNSESNSDEQSVKKLLAGRADVAIIQIETAQAMLEQSAYKGKFEILAHPFLELPLYLGVSRLRYERDPRFVEALWTDIRDLRASPEWRVLAPHLAR
ncbi:substrate-binding periplasmic protein [Undibacterium parvum]|uniref:Transporter substrate-binding domain-containing protein n=1 Tax=Undibacterium parvum TaxID=401471 RepID=A0A3Q9BQ03_9BURK|nr:transporter substrate-binding domain-containing protein [Undibacterium parvum]AZP11893.1 transporter substrate-binding domain-containing protein [Undibacterium parvum]